MNTYEYDYQLVDINEEIIFDVVARNEKEALEKIFEIISNKSKFRVDPRMVI